VDFAANFYLIIITLRFDENDMKINELREWVGPPNPCRGTGDWGLGTRD